MIEYLSYPNIDAFKQKIWKIWICHNLSNIIIVIFLSTRKILTHKYDKATIKITILTKHIKYKVK